MRPSQFRRDGDEFLAVWEQVGIGISFTRIRETDSGMIYAELDVQSIRPDAVGTLLSPTRTNLVAASDRRRLADLLSRRAPEVLWDDALESSIGRVIAEWRTPEPLVDLWDVPDPGELLYLFRPLVVENETNIWFADEQSFKSYLAAVLAVCVATGRVVECIGPPSKTGTVLYYDWETQGASQRRRLTRIANGMGLGAVRGIHYRRMTRPLVDVIGLIRAEASRLDARLVIFDSLAWMCNGDLNKTEIALPVMTAVGSVQGTTRLVLAHHAKAGRPDGESKPTVYGSAFFEASSRNRWLLRKSQDEGSQEIRVGLYHKKGSDDERHPSIGLAFRFDNERDAVSVGSCLVSEDPELLKEASPSAKILAALRETAFCKASVEEIAKAAGLKEATTKAHLRRMDGTFVTNVNRSGGGRGNAGVWALLSRNGQTDTDICLSKEEKYRFFSASRKTDIQKPIQTDMPYRFSQEEDETELPF